ncbi:hypothetical protein [Aquibacillus rhizosphaerae]|uniref:DUF3789 domain-containing protein n=1 Tax=Aquibacillus rhizosphaerae TaxID=3051431 RepID=A0ABT7LBQ9_9BACI|nr:hypothetical protein [Aquibacillus sp. LR5S19]MDL4842707.1 hypothetical protein [Aquibacillus sp. LR5S19]
MFVFVIGTILVGMVGTFTMSLMVVAKRADQMSDKTNNIDFLHP